MPQAAPTSALQPFIQSCARSLPPQSDQKTIGWEPIVALLVYEGMKSLLPELKQWVKLGYQALLLKRQELEKRLIQWGKTRELDVKQTEAASRVIAEKLDGEILSKIIDAWKEK